MLMSFATLVGSLKKDQNILAKDVEGLGKAIDDAIAKVKVKHGHVGQMLTPAHMLTIYLGLLRYFCACFINECSIDALYIYRFSELVISANC